MDFLNRRALLKTGVALCCSADLLRSAKTLPSKIQIGCCVRLAKLPETVNAGFDYIEPGAADLAELSNDQFQETKAKVLASPIRCEAFNSFIRRKDLVVVGPNVNLSAVKEYVDSTLDRSRQLGASIVVWGSSGSRNVPAGFPRQRAWDQIAVFLQAIAPIAARHEIVISLEPLNRKESNILNTGSEALKMVKQVNRPEIQMIIDYYHLRLEEEPLSIFEQAHGHINHLHFARPEGRIWPVSPTGDPLYAAFFATLRRLHWSGGISIEGKGNPEDNGRQSLAFFRQELSA